MKPLVPSARASLTTLLDLILPRRARRIRAEALESEDIPLCPTVHDLLGQKITTLMDYEDPRVTDLIQSLKYDGSARAAQLCASVLAEFLTEEIASERLFSTQKIIIIPVPLHASRKRERGFNQIELVLRELPKEFRDGKVCVANELLERTRATSQQTRLHRSERLSNVAGAFGLPKPADLKKTHVYVIDDVTTTGATLVNAATPLRRAGANVTLIALARA